LFSRIALSVWKNDPYLRAAGESVFCYPLKLGIRPKGNGEERSAKFETLATHDLYAHGKFKGPQAGIGERSLFYIPQPRARRAGDDGKKSAATEAPCFQHFHTCGNTNG
jgi:hypothetical protein